MRILIVDPLASTLPYDTALAKALSAQGHAIFVATRTLAEAERQILDGLNAVEVPLTNVLLPAPRSVLPQRLASLARHLRYGWELRRLLALVRRTRPDAIHVQWCVTPLAELLLLRLIGKNATTVLTVHDPVPYNGERVSSYLVIGLQSLMRTFDRLVVHTERGRQHLIAKGLRADRIAVIPHGPLLALGASEGPVTIGRRPNGRLLRFLALGILRPYKGLDLLIQAVAALPHSIRERARFRIAGKPDMDVDQIKRLAAERHVDHLFEFDLRFIPDDELSQYISDHDVAVFPYRQIDASGIYAMTEHFGMPAIATRLGIFEERIIHGRNGLLVDRDSPESLAQAIGQMISEDGAVTRMAAEMKQTAASAMTWAEIATKTTELYAATDR